MSIIHVPAGFSWVTASLLSLAGVLQFQSFYVGRARKTARIAYPQAYADKAEQESSKDAMIFNCKQRAHQNTLEQTPIIVLTTLISSLQYPIFAAAACGLWTVSRIVYTIRYGSGDPRKRATSAGLTFLLSIGLCLLSGKVVFDLIKASV